LLFGIVPLIIIDVSELVFQSHSSARLATLSEFGWDWPIPSNGPPK